MLGRAQIRNAPSKSVAAKSVAVKRPSAWQNPWQNPWQSPWQGLWRQAGWGLAAAAALSVAVLSSRDDVAPPRVAALFSSLRSQQEPPAAHSFDAEAAARQLAQAMRNLADDRDKLAARLSAIDREVHDMSGALKQQIEAAKAEAIKTAKQAPPWPESAPPVPMTLADVAVMVKTVSPAPASAADPPASTAATSAALATNGAEHAPPETTASLGQAYGVDLGSASTMKALHHRWASLRTAHPQLFEGIQPVVSIKENPRTGRTELHLIVGPYANAETAAQFCDFVVPFRVSCQPAMFDGSRLALQ
jgi:hypothetical protein